VQQHVFLLLASAEMTVTRFLPARFSVAARS
jgi:hypothetical protein